MKSLICWSAVIGGLFWIVKGAAILLLGFQPPLLFEIALLFFAVGIWGMYGPVNGRSFPLARLALISALLAGISAVLITLAYWFAPDLLSDGISVTILTPFFCPEWCRDFTGFVAVGHCGATYSTPLEPIVDNHGRRFSPDDRVFGYDWSLDKK